MSTPPVPQPAKFRRHTATRLTVLTVVLLVATASVGLVVHSWRIDSTRAAWVTATGELHTQAKKDEDARADYESEKRNASIAVAATEQLVAASAGTIDRADRTALDRAAKQLAAAATAAAAPALLAAPKEPDRTIVGYTTATATAKYFYTANATRVLTTINAIEAMTLAEARLYAATTNLARSIPANLLALKKANPHADPVALRDAETMAGDVDAEASLVQKIEAIGAYVDAASAARHSQESATALRDAAVALTPTLTVVSTKSSSSLSRARLDSETASR